MMTAGLTKQFSSMFFVVFRYDPVALTFRVCRGPIVVDESMLEFVFVVLILHLSSSVLLLQAFYCVVFFE